MKKASIFLCVVILIFSQLMISAYASGEIDLQSMTISELTELKSEIEMEIESRTTDAPIDESAVEDTVLSLTKNKVEDVFSDRGISIEWAWISYTYEHDGAFCSLKTHIDYTSNGEKVKPDVYSEAYPFDGKYELVFLSVGDEVLIDERESLPAEITIQTEVTYESIAKDELDDDFIIFTEADGVVFVSFTLSENWNNEYTRRYFFIEVEAICKAYTKLIENDSAFKRVEFVAYGEFVDTYGNTSNDIAMKCEFSKKTIEKIDWDYFLTDNIPDVADDYWCHPGLAED